VFLEIHSTLIAIHPFSSCGGERALDEPFLEHADSNLQ
jgi:hypothetical protein